MSVCPALSVSLPSLPDGAFRRLRVYLTLLAVLLSFGAAARENVVFRQISLPEGLSQESVNVIAQDVSGFIWIGTQEGLNRYDGHQMRVFLHDASAPQSLPSDWVNDLLTTPSGALWIATRRGLATHDPVRDVITPFVGVDGMAFPRADVIALGSGPDNQIWVGTDQGLFLIDETQQTFTRLPLPGEAADDPRPVQDMTLTEGGDLLLITTAGDLLSGNADGLTVSPLSTDLPAELTRLWVTPGQIWIGTQNNGVAVINRVTQEVVTLRHDPKDPASLPSDRVTAITNDAKGRIWVGSDAGLSYWDEGRQRFENYASQPGVLASLSDNRVTSLFQDRGDVLWVGTYSGANTWNVRISAVAHFHHRDDDLRSLSSDVVTSFASTRAGDLYVGTFGGGLNRFNSSRGQFEVISDLPDQRVMSLATDAQQRILIGTRGSGLLRYTPSTGRVETFRHDPERQSSLSADAITRIFVDSRSRVWVCTFGGGVNLMTGDDQFTRFGVDDSGLSSDRVISAGENPVDGSLWFGTHDAGVSILSASGGWTALRAPEDLPSDAVVAVDFSDRFAWIGTRDSGLVRVAIGVRPVDRPESVVFDRSDGLASNAIMGLEVDSSGRVWLTTNRGLAVVDEALSWRRHYDLVHGLQGLDFNSGAHGQSTDGELFFGGNNGFNRFRPEQLLSATNESRPPIALTAVYHGARRRQFEEPLSALDQFSVGYAENTVGFEFALLDYTNPRANRYRYRLTPLESDWNEVGNLNRATYSNLDFRVPYQFEVQASNNDGVWSDRTLQVAVDVTPPPWRTRWAYGLYLVTGLLAFWGLAAGISRRTRLRSEAIAHARLRTYLECLDQATDSVAIVRPDGAVAYQNRAGEALFGDPDSPAAHLFADPVRRENAIAQAQAEGRCQHLLGDEDEFGGTFVDLSMTAVKTAEAERAVIAIARDVTQQKRDEIELKGYRDQLELLVEERTKELAKKIRHQRRTQEQLEVSLEEKGLLLKEVHHRVKNNMQVISSLLSLQVDELTDPTALQLVSDSQHRIRSMALIHESLYQSDNLVDIDFDDYLGRLTDQLNRAYQRRGNQVDIRIDAERVHLDVESAVPCGLIVNELVTNALKHAFVGLDRPAQVQISTRPIDGQCEIRVQDNGVGFPADKNFGDGESMGTEIICILTEQLGGTIELNRDVDEGSEFVLRFPFSVKAERQREAERAVQALLA